MNKQVNTNPKGSSFSSFIYMSLWFIGAIGALAYMAFLMDSTDLNLRPLAKTVAANKTPAKTEKLLTDIRDGIGQTNHALKQLNVKYYGLDDQVANLRKNIDVLNKKQSTLSKRVSQVEQLTSPKTSQKQQSEKSIASNQLEKIDVTGSVIPLSKTKIIAKGQKKKTASIVRPVIKQKLEKSDKLNKSTQITQTQFAISLGNFQNIKQLKRAWARLNKKYKSALTQLKPRYVTIVVNNQAQYKLVSGPLKNALDAAKICYHLQQAKTYCKQTIYQGSDI